MTAKGKNQSYARAINKRIILDALCECEMSASELAVNMGLSNAALTKILSTLTAKKLIKQTYKQGGKRGRQSVYYTIDGAYCCLAALDFSSGKASIVVSDFCENILTNYIVENAGEVTEKSLHLILLKLRDLLKSKHLSGLPLCALTVAAPGKINRDTGKVMSSYYLNSLVNVNIKQAVQSVFDDIPVYIANDTQYCLIAEKQKGELKNISDGLMLLINSGIGGAILAENRVMQGGNGYAGEFGLALAVDGDRTDYLDTLGSFEGMRKKIFALCGQNLSNCEIIQEYNSGQNSIVTQAVESAALSVGKALKNFVEIFDCHKIVLSGRVTEFDSRYLDIVSSAVEQCFQKCDVKYSAFNNEGITVGAVSKAKELALKNI